ncbi:hypothetical protein [Roseovarius phycicola]|uniref:Uncharacterized protein n=1 Tax=Roseovarius phycicola TaxID=3080976 RepID=A0ABZ2HE27_9RHOB
MNFSPGHTGAHPVEPKQTGAHSFEQEWLSVNQAVAYCAELGLARTPKTVRKWAERSSSLPDGDVVSRKQDTMWGYRWQIEKASLTRKVEEELELRSTTETEPVRTGAPEVSATENEKTLADNARLPSDAPEPACTGSEQFAPVQPVDSAENQHEPSAHQFEPVTTRSETERVLEEVRERLEDKDKEIAFLRGQLADAQAEIGRRASSTDEALKTIDRVVRSFELQAEANRAAVLEAGKKTEERPQETTVVATEISDNPHGHQDIRRV